MSIVSCCGFVVPVPVNRATLTHAPPVNDGGAAVVVSTREWADKNGKEPQATIRAYATHGLAPELVGFWSACGFVPVRLGLRREASSGCHALMMLRPLSTAGKSLAGKARARLARGFMANRRGPLADLEPPLAQALARNLPMPPDDGSPDAVDWAEAAAFAFAHRGPDAAFDALRRVVDAARDDLAPGDRAALEARFVDCEAWPAVIDRLGVQGRRYAIERFRLALRPPVIARIGRDEVERLVNVANHDPASQ